MASHVEAMVSTSRDQDWNIFGLWSNFGLRMMVFLIWTKNTSSHVKQASYLCTWIPKDLPISFQTDSESKKSPAQFYTKLKNNGWLNFSFFFEVLCILSYTFLIHLILCYFSILFVLLSFERGNCCTVIELRH